MWRAGMALVLLLGCAKEPEFLPLEVGTVWTYTVRAGFASFVEPVKVSRKVPVAGVDGVELAGPLGVTRLGWRKGVLFTDLTSNASYQPPLPLYDQTGNDRKWGGVMTSMGKAQKCTAVLKHQDEKITLGSRTIQTRLSILEIKTPRTTIELKTWFQPGVGIVQQQQRTGGKLDVSIQLLS